MASQFSLLIDELRARYRELQERRELHRAVQRSHEFGQAHAAAMSALNNGMDVMAKSMLAQAAQHKETQRRQLRSRFGDFVAQADAASKAGQLSAEQASRLDVLIPRMGERIAAF